MKLSNANRAVAEAVEQLITRENNHDPMIPEICQTVTGTVSSSPFIEGMVKRALPSVHSYLQDELKLRVVPVNPLYYADPDLGGLGRKAPRSMLAARSVLAVAGKPIAGIVYISGKSGNGKYLWDAHLLFWHKVQLVMRENYGLKLQSYVDRQWLQAGRLDNLSIQDIQQQLLTA